LPQVFLRQTAFNTRYTQGMYIVLVFLHHTTPSISSVAA
jgi:hypothetical protein